MVSWGKTTFEAAHCSEITWSSCYIKCPHQIAFDNTTTLCVGPNKEPKKQFQQNEKDRARTQRSLTIITQMTKISSQNQQTFN